jgi:carbon-monoxide dehydrogenase large subunit
VSTRQFGARVQRNEDDRLIRGKGRFVDDIPLPSALHGAFVRSPHPHARILSIDTSAARAHPGVLRVYTHADLGPLDVLLPLLIPHPCITHGRTQYALAHDEVFYGGQAVAFVVAEDRYIAEDAAALVDVRYEQLPVEIDIEEASRPGAPLVHADVPDNVAAHFVQRCGDAAAAFAAADHVTSIRVRVDRSTAAPMECLATAARWDEVSGELTVWSGTQTPIGLRGALASLFELDENYVRVIAPDVGGGFGPKILFPYSHEIMVPFAAHDLGRPVKFIEDRSENFVNMTQERTQIHDIELAATADGVVVGLRDRFLHDTGAFIPYGIAVAQVASTSIASSYRIPNVEVEFSCVYTPTVPVTPYRGCGRPQANFAIERALDQLADELGLDRFEIRRRNFIQPSEFPYARDGLIFADGLPVTLDSGEYDRCLTALEEALDVPAFRAEQAAAREQGRLLGLGMAFYVEGTGLGPYEGGHVRVHPITGKVFVNTGLTTQGQGHKTTWAQIVADQLGVQPSDVIVVEGDTGVFDWGCATFASRSAVVAGNAIHKTAVKARAMILRAAANMLEADPEDLELADGRVFVRGSGDPGATLAEVATMSNPLRYAFNKAAERATQFAPAASSSGPALPEGHTPGIEAEDYYAPPHAVWAYGAHGAIIEIDPVTCNIDIRKYVCVHDCGNMINPVIIEGQVAGGVAQGLGGAFYEYLDYGTDGVLKNASFMEFLVPYATEVPDLTIIHQETPSPLNPLGVKGIGEAGTISVPSTIASAVDDALAGTGAPPVRQVPLSPVAIHRALYGAVAAR